MFLPRNVKGFFPIFLWCFSLWGSWGMWYFNGGIGEVKLYSMDIFTFSCRNCSPANRRRHEFAHAELFIQANYLRIQASIISR